MNVLEDKFYPNKKLANTTKKKKKTVKLFEQTWTNEDTTLFIYFIFLWSHSVESDSLLPHGL